MSRTEFYPDDYVTTPSGKRGRVTQILRNGRVEVEYVDGVPEWQPRGNKDEGLQSANPGAERVVLQAHLLRLTVRGTTRGGGR